LIAGYKPAGNIKIKRGVIMRFKIIGHCTVMFKEFIEANNEEEAREKWDEAEDYEELDSFNYDNDYEFTIEGELF
jgi:hypothetical protein